MTKTTPVKHSTSKREEIRKQATRLFRQKGYNATSMRKLAIEVGIEAASLYNHIDNKAALLKNICFDIADAFTSQMNMIENSHISQAMKVDSIIRFHIQMMLKHFEEVYVSNHEWKHLPEPYLTNFLQQRRDYEKRFTTIIKKGISKKEFKSIDPYIAVLTILSAVRGIEFWHRSKNRRNAVEMENDLASILINGLKK